MGRHVVIAALLVALGSLGMTATANARTLPRHVAEHAAYKWGLKGADSSKVEKCIRRTPLAFSCRVYSRGIAGPLENQATGEPLTDDYSEWIHVKLRGCNIVVGSPWYATDDVYRWRC